MIRERLQTLIDQFPSRRVAVIGDFFLDKYLDADPALLEKSIETGKNAHQVVSVRCSPGAAGTIVNNLAALGSGRIMALGAVGDDGEAYDLIKCLDELNVATDGLLQTNFMKTPTYLKPRDAVNSTLAGEHQRYDIKNRRPIPVSVVNRVVESLDSLLGDLDAVIIADQVEEDNCGVITEPLRCILAERAIRHSSVIFWADSRRHIGAFRNVIIKPNQAEVLGRRESRSGEHLSLQDVRSALPELRQRIGAPVFVTLGEQGMMLSDPAMGVVPGVIRPEPVDPTGAGDSATAGTVLALASGATFPEAALVGNLVASITVEQLATTGTASPRQLLDRLEVWHQQNEDALLE